MSFTESNFKQVSGDLLKKKKLLWVNDAENRIFFPSKRHQWYRSLNVFLDFSSKCSNYFIYSILEQNVQSAFYLYVHLRRFFPIPGIIIIFLEVLFLLIDSFPCCYLKRDICSNTYIFSYFLEALATAFNKCHTNDWIYRRG